MEKENYLMYEQVSQDSFHSTKGHLKDIHGRREADEETNNLKTRQCMARYVEAYV